MKDKTWVASADFDSLFPALVAVDKDAKIDAHFPVVMPKPATENNSSTYLIYYDGRKYPVKIGIRKANADLRSRMAGAFVYAQYIIAPMEEGVCLYKVTRRLTRSDRDVKFEVFLSSRVCKCGANICKKFS